MKKFFLSFLTFILFVILIILLLLGYILLRYRGWEKEFQSNLNKEYVIDDSTVKEIDLGEKISTFALSFEDVAFLELTVKELGSIFFTTLDSYVGKEVSIEKIYIVPSDSIWLLYAEVKYEKVSLWISIDLNKDDIQSAQVYITKIYVGPFKVSDFLDWVDFINKGIGESIVTLNENGLVGRYIENIELMDESIILKGSRY